MNNEIVEEVKEESGWDEVGMCMVDSGQLLLIDPCYIKDYIEDKPFIDYRCYEDVETKKQYVFREGDFHHYESKISDYDGATPNDLIGKKQWVANDENNPNRRVAGVKESYASISYGTIKGDTYQLRLPSTAIGLGVAFRSGCGDGRYPVYAKMIDGEVAEVKIVMIKPERS